MRPLKVVGQLSQIALAVVAIFGYFYTVQPIYQKERLAEQVAQYEGVIREQGPKVAALEQQLASLRQERQQLSIDLQHEREQLSAELKTIQRQLSLARDEKSKIESQIQFMTYKYRLPDGRPATTMDEVREAQEADITKSFFSYLPLECGLIYGDRDLFTPGYVKLDPKEKSLPFKAKELTIWNDEKATFPLKRALECIDLKASEFAKRYDQNYRGLVDRIRTEATQKARAAASAQQWAPPLNPSTIIDELEPKRAVVEKARVAALKKVEEDFADWESYSDPYKRALYKHNYTVGKQNAEAIARNALFNLEWEYQGKADNFRKAIRNEIERLLGRTPRS